VQVPADQRGANPALQHASAHLAQLAFMLRSSKEARGAVVEKRKFRSGTRGRSRYGYGPLGPVDGRFARSNPYPPTRYAVSLFYSFVTPPPRARRQPMTFIDAHRATFGVEPIHPYLPRCHVSTVRLASPPGKGA
jgi:hypothetical protein